MRNHHLLSLDFLHLQFVPLAEISSDSSIAGCTHNGDESEHRVQEAGGGLSSYHRNKHTGLYWLAGDPMQKKSQNFKQ